MGGEGMRGGTRPRAKCPGCGRSVAVTFGNTSTAYLRSHVSAPGTPCPWSRRALSPFADVR